MRDGDMDALLLETAEDRQLTRSERKALRAVVRDEGLDAGDLARFRARAFMIAQRIAKGGRPTADVLDWLEDTIKALLPARGDSVAEVHFSPGEDPRRAVVAHLENARKTVDICVFTITDDRISDAIRAAHRRGVQIRIISDDDKSEDRGSDVDRLGAAGIAVRVDRTDAHMHHKYALFDRTHLLTGSYNWTRSAWRENQENILVTNDPRLIAKFGASFDRLWKAFED